LYKEVTSNGLSPQVATPADSEGFVTVTNKRKNTVAPTVKNIKSRRQPLIGVRNSTSLPAVTKKQRTKAIFISRFCPDVTTDDVVTSLKEQLSLKKLVCTRLKTKFSTYASFHVSVLEDEFPPINNTGVWPAGCLIASFYGKLTPDLFFPPSTPLIGNTCFTSDSNQEPGGSPDPSQKTSDMDKSCDFANTDGAQGKGAPALVNV
jgi:hypothetical protein